MSKVIAFPAAANHPSLPRAVSAHVLSFGDARAARKYRRMPSAPSTEAMISIEEAAALDLMALAILEGDRAERAAEAQSGAVRPRSRGVAQIVCLAEARLNRA